VVKDCDVLINYIQGVDKKVETGLFYYFPSCMDCQGRALASGIFVKLRELE
jgi:hypothetical protein